MASQAAKRKLVVCGGSGFLGSRICKATTARGWDVVSISRSGEPNWSSITASPAAPEWSKSVSWQKANILQPDSYKQLLKEADVVVHSMGILLEADYKGVLQGKEPILAGLQRAFSSSKAGTQNPLERKEGEALESQEKDGQLTYEVMNRDSAIALAEQASKASVPIFVYISAAAGAPILPSRYITTKRAAESTISSIFPDMRTIFIRSPFLYDSSRTLTMPLAAMTSAGSLANSLLGGRLTPFLGAGVTKPLKADLVAEAVVEAVEDDNVRGAVDPKQIETLGMRAWRKGML